MYLIFFASRRKRSKRNTRHRCAGNFLKFGCLWVCSNYWFARVQNFVSEILSFLWSSYDCGLCVKGCGIIFLARPWSHAKLRFHWTLVLKLITSNFQASCIKLIFLKPFDFKYDLVINLFPKFWQEIFQRKFKVQLIVLNRLNGRLWRLQYM